MNSILETFRRQGMQVRAETPEERAAGESLLATVRAATSPDLWRPPGSDAPSTSVSSGTSPTSPPPIPAGAAAPAAVAPPVAALARTASLAPQAMPTPALSRQHATDLWSRVAADLNAQLGLTAGGPPRPEGGLLSFIEPRAGRSAGPVWDAVAEKLNAEMRARASGEASAAGGQPANLWDGVAAKLNTEGRAGNAGFITPGAHGAHAESFR